MAIWVQTEQIQKYQSLVDKAESLKNAQQELNQLYSEGLADIEKQATFSEGRQQLVLSNLNTKTGQGQGLSGSDIGASFFSPV